MTTTERALLAQSIVAGVARRPVAMNVAYGQVALQFALPDSPQLVAEVGDAAYDALVAEVGDAAYDALAAARIGDSAAFPDFDRVVVPTDHGYTVHFTVHLGD